MKYKCTYYSGCAKSYDGGIWEKKETDKIISFEQVEESFFNPNYTKIRIQKFYNKDFKDVKARDSSYTDMVDYGYYANNGHLLKCWQNDTYTAYPNQCGTPYYFEPIL